jgi:NAD(P) transhydrogenase subunit beta
MREEKEVNLLLALTILSSLYGLLLVLPVQGNNIPVAISVLNSITGFATLMVGLIYENQMMLVSGIVVWSAGILLAFQMSQALNRSLFSIFFQNKEELPSMQANSETIVKEISAIDVSILIAYAKRVVVVPGYGFGVSQAQYICQELDQVLTEKGVEVLYAIHPVAGRMPGHMNVLLAEANIPYSRYLQLDEANQQFPITDIVLVIGANDIVNPKALSDKKSSLYGMPILEVYEAKSVIVLKKGTNSSYSGEVNPLFFHEKTSILFGDAKQSLNRIVKEIIKN